MVLVLFNNNNDNNFGVVVHIAIGNAIANIMGNAAGVVNNMGDGDVSIGFDFDNTNTIVLSICYCYHSQFC